MLLDDARIDCVRFLRARALAAKTKCGGGNRRRPGLLRYANNSNYKNDVIIRKEVYVGPEVLKEIERIVLESEILAEDDHNWFVVVRVFARSLARFLSRAVVCAGMKGAPP